MGTTLTGTTPQDTYDSLIKVTDNGPLSGTAKYLSDGLGNDSVLALSTSRVGVGTATPSYKLDVDVSTDADWAARIKNTSSTGYGLFVEGSENSGQYILGLYNGLAYQMVVTGAGNVGIGTSSPSATLDIEGASGSEQFRVGNTSGGTDFGITVTENSTVVFNSAEASTSRDLVIQTGGVERARFTAGGLTFNGDTAAANALDDYEEGTWTMGISFGGGTTGITYSNNTGTYTKVGRKVTVNGYLGLSSKGSSTGGAALTGLPFAIPNVLANYAAASLYLDKVTFANQYQAIGNINTTNVGFSELTEAGVVSSLNDGNFANNSEIIINFTYFV